MDTRAELETSVEPSFEKCATKTWKSLGKGSKPKAEPKPKIQGMEKMNISKTAKLSEANKNDEDKECVKKV